MPRLLTVAERNDVAFTDLVGTLNSGGNFLIQGLARAGLSSAAVGSWFQGTYGALLLNADGSYTYRLDNQDPDTNVLAAGQIAEDRFTYTYTQDGATRTDTVTVQVSGIDEPAQAATITNAPILYAAPTDIGALTQIVSTAEFGVRLEGYGNLFQSANHGSIRVGGPGAVEARGLEVGVAHWEYYSAFENDGRIEAVAGLPGHGAVGLLGSSAAPLVNNGVVRALNTAEGIYYQVRAVGIDAGPHDGIIVNNGVVEAVSANGEAFGIWTSGLYLTVRNTGFIYVSGGLTQDPLGIVGIRNGQSTGILIENSGTLHVESSRGAPTVGISIFRDSTNVHSYGTVVNSGTIVADIAIKGYAGYYTGLHVTNSGHIEGDLDFDLAQNIVSNLAGAVWIGDLMLGLNEDVVRNGGFVQGNVTLGNEDDLFDGRGGIVIGFVDGGDGFDVLLGGAGVDLLRGGAGRDRLIGGGGADSLTGGADGDVFVYQTLTDSTSAAADTITDFQTGLDRIDVSALAPLSIALQPAGGETVVTVATTVGALVLHVAGAIAASDFIVAPSGAAITGTAGADSLFATVDGSQILGGGGDDVLDGSGGNDLLDGGTGADLMRGGAGDDVYLVDNDNDRHIELEGEGIDEVRTLIPYSLQAFVENLVVLGTAPVDVQGNRLDNIITGNAGNNFIYGRNGNDILIGGGGWDVMEGGNGADLFVYRAVSDSTAAARDSIVFFETGIDRIDLTAIQPVSVALQTTIGDYWQNFAVTNIVTIETAGGAMTIRVDGKLDMADFILPSLVTGGTPGNDLLSGGAGADRIDGGGGNDVLTGLAGGDQLTGGGGDDRLEGNAGADLLDGGGGVDIFVFAGLDDSRLTALRSDGTKILPDAIVGFISGVDKIDLSAIDAIAGTAGNDAFTFIGTGAFTGNAGELRCAAHNAQMFVFGDVDGNGFADFQIAVTATALQAGDFFL